MAKKKKAIVYIDGQNFLFRIEMILLGKKLISSKRDLVYYNIKGLIEDALQKEDNLRIKEIVFYSAKLRKYEESRKISEELINSQRRLKRSAEKQGINFLLTGNVRRQEINSGKQKNYTYNEKGVDTKIAIDMVIAAYELKAEVLVLCSSDSDLQPAVAAAIGKGIEVVYLGFKSSPNKGLVYTATRSILIEDKSVIGNHTIQ